MKAGQGAKLPPRRLYRPIFTHFVAEARRVVQDHAPPFCTMKLRTARGFRAGHRANVQAGFLGAFQVRPLERKEEMKPDPSDDKRFV